MALAIEAAGLAKRYGGRPVVAGIDLQIERGWVYGLLGPNGAGKTTTVRMLATLTAPDAGWARVAGFDVAQARREVRRRISLTGQYAALDDAQTGRENLEIIARLRGLRSAAASGRAGELLTRFALDEVADRRVCTYSGGLRRRLDIAAGLITPPEVLFLDEPTTGLDPRSRAAVWEVVAELAQSGVTIFLTTQYLEEADRLADRIAVIDGGHLVAEGTPAELKQRVSQQRLDLRLRDVATYQALLAERSDTVLHRDGTELTLGFGTDGSAEDARRLLDGIDPSRERITSFSQHIATLDDVFLALTERSSSHV